MGLGKYDTGMGTIYNTGNDSSENNTGIVTTPVSTTSTDSMLLSLSSLSRWPQRFLTSAFIMSPRSLVVELLSDVQVN